MTTTHWLSQPNVFARRLRPALLLMALSACVLSLCRAAEDSTQVAADTSARAAATLAAILGGSINGIGVATTQDPIPFFGIGNFLQREWLKGSAYLGTELTLLILRHKWQQKFGSPSTLLYPDVVNDSVFTRKKGLSSLSRSYQEIDDFTRVTLANVSLIDLYSTYQSLHEKGSGMNKVHLESNIPSLMLSPFRPKYLANPWVFVPPILLTGLTYLTTKYDHPLSSVRTINMFKTDFTPNQATLFVASYNVLCFVPVASGEEMFFRGVIHTELTDRTNSTVAIGGSSLLCGLYHVPYHGWRNGLGAGLISLYFAYRYETNGYDLGEAIALHFWLDWLGETFKFLSDPRGQSIVYSITWKF